jgi:hypothetical protein
LSGGLGGDGVDATVWVHCLGAASGFTVRVHCLGAVAVVVATSAAHRAEALAACRVLIDDLKHGLPAWKHQIFADGSQEWVGLE